jgi:hypothetical protein
LVPGRYPLLNDLKLHGSRGLAAVANRARLFGTVDAMHTSFVVVTTTNVNTGELTDVQNNVSISIDFASIDDEREAHCIWNAEIRNSSP